MNTRHVAIWMDHKEDRIFLVDPDTFDTSSVRWPKRHVHRHPVSHDEKEHPADAKHFFDDVARAGECAGHLLFVRPSTAKLEFVRHLHHHRRELESKVVGVETVDHPTNGELVTYVRRYFRATDRMRGTSP